MKLLHELFNRGGVFAPLVVATVHAVFFLALFALSAFVDRPLRWLSRTYQHLRGQFQDWQHSRHDED